MMYLKRYSYNENNSRKIGQRVRLPTRISLDGYCGSSVIQVPLLHVDTGLFTCILCVNAIPI